MPEFEGFGAQRFEAALNPADVGRIAKLFGAGDSPGKRLARSDVGSVVDLLANSIGQIAESLIGSAANPVRAILLDKSKEANWRLGWHQDRTIAVEERIETEGFGPWSVKAGQLHVQPPHAITAAMATLRIHVDAVGPGNAPLEIIPGSHQLGRLSNDEVDRLASCEPPFVCLANAGDIWAYPTAIVHRSVEQKTLGRRRVLQVDYSAIDLPGGLRWVSLMTSASAS